MSVLNCNSDLIDEPEQLVFTASQFKQWLDENHKGKKEFVAENITVVDSNGDDLEFLPGRWKCVEVFQSGKMMYRRY
jgi:hypothetical protein